MKAKQAGILAVILGSTCCIGPLLLVTIGVGSGAVFIGRYHWFFIIAAMVALTWAWAKYLREKTACDCEHKAMAGHRSAIATLLITTALVIGFAISRKLSRFLGEKLLPHLGMETGVIAALQTLNVLCDVVV